MPTTDDSQDWCLVQSGDHIAFGRVFERHADTMHRFLGRRCGDPDVAEDLLGEVFLQAWRQRDRVHLHEGSLRPWLFGVATNLVRRHWRGRSRFGRAVARLPRTEHQPNYEDAVVNSIDARRRFEHLRDAVEALPQAHVEVLLLRVWEGLDYDTIATALDVPVGTVRSRLSRARARLRDQLDDKVDLPPDTGVPGPPATEPPNLQPSTAERCP